jgi:import inner membrane translocase subunit TIM17
MEQVKQYLREPCPWRIIEDSGAGFAIGAIGGAFWHGFKGMKNSPRGERFRGSLAAIKARAPVLGGNFAVWGTLFSACDCTLVYLRHKEDPWNAIMSGAITGGLLQVRNGMGATLTHAIFGGVFLAIIEGIGIGLSRFAQPPPSRALHQPTS